MVSEHKLLTTKLRAQSSGFLLCLFGKVHFAHYVFKGFLFHFTFPVWSLERNESLSECMEIARKYEVNYIKLFYEI